MSISYNKLCKNLIDLSSTKTNLGQQADLSISTLIKLGKDQQVRKDVLINICEILNCSISDKEWRAL